MEDKANCFPEFTKLKLCAHHANQDRSSTKVHVCRPLQIIDPHKFSKQQIQRTNQESILARKGLDGCLRQRIPFTYIAMAMSEWRSADLNDRLIYASDFFPRVSDQKMKTDMSKNAATADTLRLKKLTLEQVKRIDEVLSSLGEYGELHLIIQNGELRYINKVESFSARKLGPSE